LNWLILRTDHQKEAYVARQIQNLGFDAWNPVQIITCRPHHVRKVTSRIQLRPIKEISILPRRIFAAVPVWAVLQGELAHIRHLVAIEHGSDSRPLSVPSEQIAAFRAEIDRENTASLALAQRASRKQKAKWRSLHDALLDMIDSAKQQLEQAA
jgi:hypothetical protein